FSWRMSGGSRSGGYHLKNSQPSVGCQVSDSFLRRHGLKYHGLILQRYGLVEGTPHNESPSLCLYMFVVPDPSFILKAMARVMYFYNLRVWSVQSATRPNLSVEDKNDGSSSSAPDVTNALLPPSDDSGRSGPLQPG